MPFPATPFILARIYYNIASEHQCENIYYLEPVGTGIGQPQLDSACAAFSAAMGALYIAYLTDSCTYVGSRFSFYNGTAELESFSSSGAGAGSITGDTMPGETAIEIQRRTGLRGRQNRGRVYLAGFGEEYGNDGVVDPTSDTGVAVKAIATYTGADKTFGSIAIHWRHYNRKDSLMVPVQVMRAMDVLVQQRKRRKPLVPTPY